MYKVKEIFYTLQGEGFHSGRAAVFCRFTGCNLWTGREIDRPKAICQFCDTDFWGMDGVNGGQYSVEELVIMLNNQWDSMTSSYKFVVFTGGEPLLQLDERLINEVKNAGFEIAVETNGTIAPPKGIDWLCVSPKSTATVIVDHANELKFVYPQKDVEPTAFERFEADNFYIQPLDDAHLLENTQKCISYCKQHPKWKLSLQTHKLLGIP